MKSFYQIVLFFLVSAVITFAIMFLLGLTIVSFSAPGHAQMYKPFPEGESVKERISTIRCMPAADCMQSMRNRNMTMAAMQVVKEEKNTYKIISTNTAGDLVVANILADNTVCILDILEDAYIGIEPKTPTIPPGLPPGISPEMLPKMPPEFQPR